MNRSRPSTSQPPAKKKLTEEEAREPMETKFDVGTKDTRPRILTKRIITEIIRTHPCAIIISENGTCSYTPVERLKIMKELVATIPPHCHPAGLAQQQGTAVVADAVEYPGVPYIFFTVKDWRKYEDTPDMWNRQVVFGSPKGSGHFLVKYVGFDSRAIFDEEIPDLEAEDPLLAKLCDIRVNFLRKIESPALIGQGAKRELCLEDHLLTKNDHLFWVYKDMEYLHSMEHRNHGLPAIFYMCLQTPIVEPPVFAYSSINILTNEVLRACQKMDAKRKKEYEKTTAWDMTNTPCEKPATCKCNKIFESYYKIHPKHPNNTAWNRRNMIPNKEGLLDFTNNDSNIERVVVECSDECGCSLNCPRRSLQRGQPSEVVVYYENETIGFGLRTAKDVKKGQLVCEYTGQLLIVGAIGEEDFTDNYRDTSYDCECLVFNSNMVITSWKIGNCGRFCAHSCIPNARFVEVHSRVFEKDPLIPRIAIFATEDIEVGQPVTLRYYPEEQMTGKVKGIKCLCRPDCKNTFPMV